MFDALALADSFVIPRIVEERPVVAVSIPGTYTPPPARLLLFQVSSAVPESQRLTSTAAPVVGSLAASPARAIGELGRFGLTIEQVAEIIGVDRRSIHNWKAGRAVSGENLRTLTLLVDTMRAIDRGTQLENRAALAQTMPGGESALEWLALHRFEDVRRALGPGGAKRLSLPLHLGVNPASKFAQGVHPDGWYRSPYAPDHGGSEGEILTKGEVGPLSKG